jgi:cytochrome c biogenesis protein ResB
MEWFFFLITANVVVGVVASSRGRNGLAVWMRDLLCVCDDLQSSG